MINIRINKYVTCLFSGTGGHFRTAREQHPHKAVSATRQDSNLTPIMINKISFRFILKKKKKKFEFRFKMLHSAYRCK